MPFTLEQKRRLMRAYAPVLFLHRGERFVPVSPGRLPGALGIVGRQLAGC